MKVSGGVGPFTFSWSNSGNYTLSNSQLPVQSVRLVNPTGATTITVTVTDQGTNCIYTASLLIKWTDEFFCYKIGTETYIKTCQNGVTVCERLRDAR